MTPSEPIAQAPPHVTVSVPAPLRTLTDGAPEVQVPAATVGAALNTLLERYPGLRRHLRTETGGLREHVNVFVNHDHIRSLEGESTALMDGDAVTIVPSIAGG